MDDVYFAIYPGELSREDRIALARSRLAVHENGAGLRGAYRSPRDGPFSPYQVVRVTAPSADHARRSVVAALGREPDQLRVHTGLDEPEA